MSQHQGQDIELNYDAVEVRPGTTVTIVCLKDSSSRVAKRVASELDGHKHIVPNTITLEKKRRCLSFQVKAHDDNLVVVLNLIAAAIKRHTKVHHTPPAQPSIVTTLRQRTASRRVSPKRVAA